MKLLNLLLWPVILPVLLLVYLFWPRSRPFFFERLGMGPMRLTKNGYLLFHVASLGEARAAGRLISELSGKVPVVLTSMTVSGRNALATAHPDLPVSLVPLDLPGIWAPFLESRRIRGILLFETEIWPSMLLAARDRKIPVGLVNGRLSSKSYRSYRRLRALVRPLFRTLSPVLVQTGTDRERFLELGVPGSGILVTGNLKWDPDPSSLDPERLVGIREWLGEDRSAFRIMGSSVHPEEARILVRACRSLAEKGVPVRCILAPRHLEILPAFLSSLPPSTAFSLRKEDRSLPSLSAASSDPARTLYILNTYGEMGALLALADVVFVGGTLVPVGGHSPVEAAFHGKPVLWGPHRDHIRDIANILSEKGAAREVSGEEDLEQALLSLARHPEVREEMGARSQEVYRSQGGPLTRTMVALEPFLRDCLERKS